MPAVVVDSSVLITFAAGEQFYLLREFYSTIHIPPEVWRETTASPKTFGVREAQQAKAEGWLIVKSPQDLAKVSTLPFNLQPGETEALALALELPGSLLLVDDAQGRKAAAASPALARTIKLSKFARNYETVGCNSNQHKVWKN